MQAYIDKIYDAYLGYFNYLVKSISHPVMDGEFNYFYFLILISLFIWGLEIIFPWRKNQSFIRKDFWLDGFYMFFNFFIFNLLLFVALSDLTIYFLKDSMSYFGFRSTPVFNTQKWPAAAQFISFFLISDFFQWCVHNLLHRIPILWKFHKLHHSVKEMGFSAHLRYHFGETFFYNSIKYIVLTLIFGFDIKYAFIIHAITITIGHLNHANLGWDYGPFKYILNNPKMHIWHHAKDLPASHQFGANFGISLSIWDYLFRTNYVPYDGRDIEIGFQQDEKFAKTFWSQLWSPFQNNRK